MVNKPYILQKDDYSCSYITAINAIINKYGVYPLKYKYDSKAYHKYLELFGELQSEEAITKFCDVLKIERIKPDKLKLKTFNIIKRYFISSLKQGYLIDATCYSNGIHSFLICDYDEAHDSFKTINAHYFTSKCAVEWLPLEILMNCEIKTFCSGYSSTKSFKHAKISCDWNMLKDFTILKVKSILEWGLV